MGGVPVIQETHTVECDCGYVGRTMTNKRDAMDDADEHVLAMVRADD